MSRDARERGTTATLLACELRMLLRDRRTLLIAVIAPLVVFPAVLLIVRATERSRQQDLAAAEVRWAVRGEDAAQVRALMASATALVPGGEDGGVRRFREVVAAAPDSVLAAGEIQLVIGADRSGDTAAVQVGYRSDRERSVDAARTVTAALDSLRALRLAGALAGAGVPSPETLARVDAQDIASAQRQGRALLGYFVTPFFVLLLLSGGSVVAADAIAGEKERGTLETLLTTAARRSDIVRAKQLAILAVGVTIALVNVLNLLVYAGLGVIDLPSDLSLSLPPAAAALVLLLFLPVAALVAAVLLALSGYVRSYKEYQVFFLPVFLLFLLPSAACVLPGVRLRSIVALIPVANISVAVKEVLAGIYDVPFLALAFVATGGAAALATRLTDRALSAERMIVPSAEAEHGLPGPARFRRHLLRNYALLWAALFLVSLWTGDRLDLRLQVALNLVVLFLGASLVMLLAYRLDARDALSLRMPAAPVWIAVLIGAPSAWVTGIGIAQLTSRVLPVPERVIEAFSQYILPPDLSLLQVVFFLAILPGICEEIAFRGLLLHGLRTKLSPIALCLAVGASFGLFHVDLFRLIPTAYLGTILAAVVVLTGSIFPAMLWHALNNATGLVPAFLGIAPDVPPLWAYPLGVLGLVVCFGILYRYRRSG